jgi:competence protein ComEC
MPRSGWIAVGAVVGAVAAGLVSDPSWLAAGALIAVCLAAAGAVRRNVPGIGLGVGAALVLARAVVGFTLAPAADVTAPGAQTTPGSTDHRAVVLSIGTPANGLQRAVVELRPPEAADRVYAWLPRYPEIAPGDVVRFGGRLEPAPTDPGFGAYLARSGIAFTDRTPSLERIGTDSTPLAQLEQLRRTVAALIADALPEPEAGLSSAMAIGLRDLVAKDVSDDFRIAGLSHVVAISGWHICLLAGVVAGMLRPLSRRPRSLIVLIAICSYSVLAGAAPSVLRAAVMASVVLLSRESGRRGQASAALAITAAAMLIAEPATITDAGFQLSVAATCGLLAWAGRLQDWLAARLPRQTPNWLLETLGVSLAAQAATLPLVLLEFGRLSLVAPLANLLIAPIVAPAMLLITVAFACGALIAVGIPSVVLAPITLVASLSVGAMIAIAHVCASLPFASVELPAPLNVVSAAVSAAVLAWMIARHQRRTGPAPAPSMLTQAERRRTARARPRLTRTRMVAAGGIGLFALLLAIVNGARPDGRLHMAVLDVGQGDSILLEGPNGGRMLVDTGPDPDRLISLLDQRLPAWDRRIDLVVITHPHEDHIAGLAMLMDRYRIGDIAEPGMIGPGPGDAAYRKKLAELGRQSRILAAGDSVWLDGIRLDVDWPLPGQVPLHPSDGGTAINNVSIVLDLHFGARRILLTGDVEQAIDPQLLAEGIAAHGTGPLDVLKVAHHGSGTATTDAFVEQMDPRVAVISAGFGNPYGHPSPATVARLIDNGARVFRTDDDGTVEISTDGTDLVAYADGDRPHPRTPSPPTPPGLGFCPIDPQVSGRGRRTYNRSNGDPHADGGGVDPSRPQPIRAARRSLRRRGRDRSLPGGRHGPPRRGRELRARGSGGTPP